MEILYRQLELGRADEKTRSVEASLSSEEPVERFWGIEILSHSHAAVDLSRARPALPLLFNHRVDEIAGSAEGLHLVDGKLRARLRFATTDRGEELWNLVRDGHLTGVSIGYAIEKMEQTGEQDGTPIYTATKWRLYEATVTPIPADFKGAGIGRQLTIQRGSDMTTKATATDHFHERESQRIRDLESIGRTFAQFGGEQLAKQCIAEGKKAEDMNAILMERIGRNAPPSAEIGLTPTEVRNFSFVRALNALANPQDRRAQEAAAYEREVSDAASRKSGRDVRGILVPSDILQAPSINVPARMFQQRDLTVGTPTAGGHAVATNVLAASFIDLLRKRAVVMSAGATILGQLVGNIAIPRQTSGATAYWVSEGSAPTESQQAIDQVTMSPKTVGGYTDISRKLLIQSSNDVENFVRLDLTKILGLEVDRVTIYGSGSANLPLGVKNTAGINTKDFAANAPTYAEIVDLETLVAADDADMGALAYLVNATGRGSLKTTEKASGTAQFIWEQGNRVNSYPAFATNQIEANDFWFGNWADIVIGLWSGVDLTIDPYTFSTTGTVRVVALQDVDIAVRHPESFCRGNNTL